LKKISSWLNIYAQKFITVKIDGKMKNPSYIEQSFSPYVFYRTRKVYISPPSLLSVVFYAKCPLHLNITNAKNRSILMEWSPRIRFRKRRRFYFPSLDIAWGIKIFMANPTAKVE